MENNCYKDAQEQYAALGVDCDAALRELQKLRISMHCWQGDDVSGFERADGALSGGIAATGNYPGKARNAGELMADIDCALSLIPGKHKLNLHAIYAVTEQAVPRDKLRPEHFAPWVEFAKARGLGLDINPTLFSHPMAADGLTLSHPDQAVREFWIAHCKAMRDVGEYFGRELGQTCLNNIWIPDGYKEVPADRLAPRARLKDSLDAVLADSKDKRYLADSLESKLFGIGVEAYTVGSHEFYLNYAAAGKAMCLLDSGHFHPTEVVSDKLPSMLLFHEKVALHVTRGVRWDSDHVVVFDEELKEIAKEIVRCGALQRVMIGLDYFDASINRIAAWVTGMRNMQKALLYALLMPHATLRAWQEEGNFTRLLAMQEELKCYPFPAVWEQFCAQNNVPAHEQWLDTVEEYERDVLRKR